MVNRTPIIELNPEESFYRAAKIDLKKDLVVYVYKKNILDRLEEEYNLDIEDKNGYWKCKLHKERRK